MAGRRIFIGDVQGCREPLERLLAKLRFEQGQDRLWFAGDLVNKGPDSLGVLRLARSIGAENVLGNHDVLLLERAAERSSESTPHLDPILAADDREVLIGWLFARPVMVHLGDLVVVHAAVRPGWTDLQERAADLRLRFDAAWDAGRSPFTDADVRFAVTARYCTADGRQSDSDWPPPGQPWRNWADLYGGTETVVFGHFARQGLLVRPRLRGLDTGCVYGGTLTAWIAEEDRLVSVGRTP